MIVLAFLRFQLVLALLGDNLVSFLKLLVTYLALWDLVLPRLQTLEKFPAQSVDGHWSGPSRG